MVGTARNVKTDNLSLSVNACGPGQGSARKIDAGVHAPVEQEAVAYPEVIDVAADNFAARINPEGETFGSSRVIDSGEDTLLKQEAMSKIPGDVESGNVALRIDAACKAG